MKILLKILVAPFALALSLLAALLVFLFDICAVLLTIASVILTVLGVALFFTPTPIGVTSLGGSLPCSARGRRSSVVTVLRK